MEQKQLKKTEILAARIRINILEMLMNFGSGHASGSLDLAEVLADLYLNQMNIDPKDPEKPDRDRLVLSKGHAGPALYSILAEKGYFPKEMLMTLNQGGTSLPSHPDRLKTPGVDMTTGSLGQGASAAAGIALAQKKRKQQAYTYLIVGDGECNEGQVWEAFQFIAANNLSNCIVLIDYNKKQLDGYTVDVLNPFSFEEKMKSFGFYAETVKGTDIESIHQALCKAKDRTSQPTCIVLDTVKGQGVEYIAKMENNHSIHFGNSELYAHSMEALLNLKEYVKTEEQACLL